MKLAEALQERADLNRKIEELRRRLNNCILVQEGEEPAEDPAALLEELDGAVARLETLMAQINLTNCRTKVQGMTLTEMIARKDVGLPGSGLYGGTEHTESPGYRDQGQVCPEGFRTADRGGYTGKGDPPAGQSPAGDELEDPSHRKVRSSVGNPTGVHIRRQLPMLHMEVCHEPHRGSNPQASYGSDTV